MFFFSIIRDWARKFHNPTLPSPYLAHYGLSHVRADVLYSLNYSPMYSLSTYYALGTLLWVSDTMENRTDRKLRVGISTMKEEKGCYEE